MVQENDLAHIESCWEVHFVKSNIPETRSNNKVKQILVGGSNPFEKY